MQQTAIAETTHAERQADAVPSDVVRAARPTPRVTITARFLLGIYLFVPLCLLAMAVDRVLLGESLIRSLPTSPDSFFYFQLLFGTPHIIASSVILFSNGAYVRAYWLRLVVFSLVLLVFFGLGFLYIPNHYEVFLAIIGAATVLHVIKQQVGIGKGLCRLASWVYDAWGWTMIAFGSVLYYAIYSSVRHSADTMWWIHGSLWLLGGIAFVLTLICHARIQTTMGRLYLWGNALMSLQSGLFYAEGYLFLAILGPRLVHDVTAFTFYVAHDMNRHGSRPQNLLYGAASKLGLGIFWVCPVLAVLLTYLIDRYTDPVARVLVSDTLGYQVPYGASFIVIGYLGLLHYYTEVFTWKHGSPYREHVAMSA